MALILAQKYRSETMVMCMERIRHETKISSEIPMTYAGRLDPMASGLVLFLAGDLRFSKEFFLKFPKTYEISWLFGYETDTYDMLGIATASQHAIPELTIEMINTLQPIGIFTQKFPAFSSRKVFGKPLFHHAKNTDLIQIIPEQSHQVEIIEYENFTKKTEPAKTLIKSAIDDIKKVSGDFRQQECIDSWENIIQDLPKDLEQYSITIEVSSGFYVRQWVHDLGVLFGTSAVTFSINRDTIGLFTMSMLNGEPYRIFNDDDPMITNLTI